MPDRFTATVSDYILFSDCFHRIYKLWYGFRLNKVLEINYDECTNANY
jgi:hypothetical protein